MQLGICRDTPLVVNVKCAVAEKEHAALGRTRTETLFKGAINIISPSLMNDCWSKCYYTEHHVQSSYGQQDPSLPPRIGSE